MDTLRSIYQRISGTPDSDSEEEIDCYRCLLVGSESAQYVAEQILTRHCEEAEPVRCLDSSAKLRRDFQCIVFMIDGSDPEAIALIHSVALLMIDSGIHESRIALTIKPCRIQVPEQHAKLLILLHKYLPKKPYYIDDDRGRGTLRAVREMLRLNHSGSGQTAG